MGIFQDIKKKEFAVALKQLIQTMMIGDNNNLSYLHKEINVETTDTTNDYKWIIKNVSGMIHFGYMTNEEQYLLKGLKDYINFNAKMNNKNILLLCDYLRKEIYSKLNDAYGEYTTADRRLIEADMYREMFRQIDKEDEEIYSNDNNR